MSNDIEEIDLVRVENQLAKWEINPQIMTNKLQFNVVRSMRKIFEEYKKYKQENYDLKELYLRTARHLQRIGKIEMSEYFLAQINACPTFIVDDINKKIIHLSDEEYRKVIENAQKDIKQKYEDKIKEQIEWLEKDIERTKISTKSQKEPNIIYDDIRKARLKAFNTKSKEIIKRLKNIINKEDK